MMQRADLILTGGRVTTLADGATPAEAAALAVRGDRVLAVGTDEEVRAVAGPSTRELRLGGRRVVPGLIDGHIHVLRAGRTWNDELRWEDVRDLSTGLRMIAERAAQTPPGRWIRVIGGWHVKQMAEGRGPTREELDAVAPDHPVYVQARYDEAQLNSLGIERMGLTSEVAAEVEQRAADTAGGGSFERDAEGRLTGKGMRLPIMSWFYSRLPEPSFEEQVESTATMSADLARLGLTGAIDGGGVNTGPPAYEALHEAWRRGRLRTRIRLFKHSESPATEHADMSGYVRFDTPHAGDGMLRVSGLGEVLLWRCHDRFGLPGDVSQAAAGDLREMLLPAAERGWTVHLHVHSREFLDVVLDVWESVHAMHPIDGLRWAIVHGEPIEERDVPRLRRLGVALSMQGIMRLSGESAIEMWGAERIASAPPVRALLDAGVPVFLGSDATRVASYNPWVNLEWFVSGLTVSGTPTLREPNLHTRTEALRGYTRGGAWATFEEHERGTLEPGRLADVAVLSDDYFEVPVERIGAIRSELTLLGGEVVWSSGAVEDR